MKLRGSIDRRTFLKDSMALGIAATAARPARLWAKDTPAPSPDYPPHLLPVQDVKIDNPFWSPRIEAARTVSLPFLLARQSHSLDSIDPRLIEGAAWFLSQRSPTRPASRRGPLSPFAALHRGRTTKSVLVARCIQRAVPAR
jgi:hypothetical protein